MLELSTLLGSFTQATRLLRLSTALGPDDRASPGLGVHTLVIADHNKAFEPNVQATVRYTQPGAVMKEDSMDRTRFPCPKIRNRDRSDLSPTA